jgi:hypothetical protein
VYADLQIAVAKGLQRSNLFTLGAYSPADDHIKKKGGSTDKDRWEYLGTLWSCRNFRLNTCWKSGPSFRMRLTLQRLSMSSSRTSTSSGSAFRVRSAPHR